MTCFRIFITLALLGCQKEQTVTTISIMVHDSDKKSIPDATVRINGEVYGKTDKNGLFKKILTFYHGTQINIEINKKSKSRYYAPAFSTFKISKKDHQIEKITATLFYVEKPTPLESISSPTKTDRDRLSHTSQEVQTVTEPTSIKRPTDKKSDQSGPLFDKSSIIFKPASHLESSNLISKMKHHPRKPLVQNPSPPRYPSTILQNKGTILFAINIRSHHRPIHNAQVLLGLPGSGNMKLACTTEKNGRCLLKFLKRPMTPVHFIISKDGFITQKKIVDIKHRGKMQVSLKEGTSIDIFTISKVYHHLRGIQGCNIYINKKKIGTSDIFGHLTYPIYSQKENLYEIEIKTSDFLPSSFSTDFIGSRSLSLIKHFVPIKPPKVSLSLLPLQINGKVTSQSNDHIKTINHHLKIATQKHIFSKKSFKKYSYQKFIDWIYDSELTKDMIEKSGWQTTPLKGELDVLIKPILVNRVPYRIELSLIDSKGKIQTAASEIIGQDFNPHSIDLAIKRIANYLIKTFPFEGAVLVDDDQLFINIGKNQDTGLEPGDTLEVHGAQRDKFGRSQLPKKIGYLKVLDVKNDRSSVELISSIPRSFLSHGDLVILRSHPKEPTSSIKISVSGISKNTPKIALNQANIYFNDAWIGSVDQSGMLEIDRDLVKERGLLRVIKSGYRDYTQEVKLDQLPRLDIQLNRESSFIQIETDPTDLNIRINGNLIGKSPITTPVPILSGFVKINVDHPNGYKPYSQIIELTEGTLALVGPRKILLEEDIRAKAQNRIQSGNLHQAIELLKKAEPSHSDYLFCRHDLGEIYLNKFADPITAAKYFGEVTKDPRVKNYNDKRFIGSHINEGLSLFLAADQLAQKSIPAAISHYEKSFDILYRISNQLRFIQKSDFEKATHSVAYYQALALQRLWKLTNQNSYLEKSYKAWQSYLNGDGKVIPISPEIEFYLKNAAIYLKQNSISLNQIDQKVSVK